MSQLGPDDWVVRSSEPIAAEVADGMVLLSARTGAYVSLNDTASAIWRRIERPIQVRALCDDIAREYDVRAEACLPQVVGCLVTLVDNGVCDVQARRGEAAPAAGD